MGFFRPGMFRRRVVVSTPKDSEPPVTSPVECDVCSREGHDRDACPGVIRTPADTERTWGRSPGTGDTFEAIADFYARFRGE